MSECTKDVIIMTKSRKNHHNCVAGLDADTGEWIRLVSNDGETQGALTGQDLLCNDNTEAQVLDVVRVPVLRNAGTDHQPENVLIAPRPAWDRLGRSTWYRVLGLCPAKEDGQVFGTWGYKLSEEEFPDHSLELIYVTDFVVRREGKPKADFVYNGTTYRYMSLTDRDYEQKPDGFHLERAYLVVSLPDVPHTDGFYYKFVAKVFPV